MRRWRCGHIIRFFGLSMTNQNYMSQSTRKNWYYVPTTDFHRSPPTGRALAFALTLGAMNQPTALTVSPARSPPCDDSAWSLRKQRAQLHRRLTVLQAHMTTNPAAPGDESDDDGDESDVCVLHLHELRTGLAEIDRLITRVSQECSCATTGIVCGVLSPKCSRPRFTARGMGASS
jgi:hypothetical protein